MGIANEGEILEFLTYIGGDVIIVDNIEKAEQIKERKNAVQS